MAHCACCYKLSKVALRGRRVWVWGEGKEFPNQSGCSIAVRGEGVLDESWLNKRFFWVIFHPVKAQEAQEMHICPKVKGLQNSHVNAVGWDNICHRPRLHFCKLVRHMWFIGFTVQEEGSSVVINWAAKGGLSNSLHESLPLIFFFFFFFFLSFRIFIHGSYIYE